jgi:Family of unknown function (DUF6220)
MQQIARALLRGFAALLLIALFVQLFTAGVAALTNPDWWNYHLACVRYSQWLVLPLPVFAAFGGVRRRYRRTILATLPIAQILLQYVFAHRALEGKLSIGLGLHAVNAGLLLIVVASLAIGLDDFDRGQFS